MRLVFGNTTLRPISAGDLEITRRYRNAPWVKNYMEYTQYISPVEQEAWFSSISQRGDLYFIITTDPNNPIPQGLIHLSDISQEHAHAWSGIFMFQPQSIGFEAWIASYGLLLFAFEGMGLRKVYAKVAMHNHLALAYNASLGFTACTTGVAGSAKASKFSSYHATAAMLEKAAQPYQRLMQRISPQGLGVYVDDEALPMYLSHQSRSANLVFTQTNKLGFVPQAQ